MKQKTSDESVLHLQLDEELRKEIAAAEAKLRLPEESIVDLAIQLGLQALRVPAQAATDIRERGASAPTQELADS